MDKQLLFVLLVCAPFISKGMEEIDQASIAFLHTTFKDKVDTILSTVFTEQCNDLCQQIKSLTDQRQMIAALQKGFNEALTEDQVLCSKERRQYSEMIAEECLIRRNLVLKKLKIKKLYDMLNSANCSSYGHYIELDDRVYSVKYSFNDSISELTKIANRLDKLEGRSKPAVDTPVKEDAPSFHVVTPLQTQLPRRSNSVSAFVLKLFKRN